MKLLVRFALILAGSLMMPLLARSQAPPPVLPAPVATAASTNGAGPKIQFNTEIYDAGTNLAGDKIRYTFIVTNTGNETLVLSNVKPSCGCTTVGGVLPSPLTSGGGTAPAATTTWTHEIAPGEIGIIPIQIATDALRGPIHKTVTVTSNDRTRPNVTLQIGGTVWLPIEVAPVSVFFGLMPDATNVNSQVVKIFNRTDTPLAVFGPSCTTNAFSAVLKTNVPGQEFELVVSAVLPSSLPPSLGTTTIQGEILLKSSATNKSTLTILVFETVYSEITIFPANIQLPVGPLALPNTSHITIRDNIASLKVSDPVVNAPGVNASLNVIQTNRHYNVFVTFPKGFEVQPGQNLALTVTTDNPHFPKLTIPVTPLPAPARPVPPSPPPATMRTGLAPPPPRMIVPAPGISSNAPASTSGATTQANTLPR